MGSVGVIKSGQPGATAGGYDFTVVRPLVGREDSWV